MGWMTRLNSQQWNEFFLSRVQTGCGATQPHIQQVLGALYPVVKQLGSEADYSHPSSVMIKNVWSYTPTPLKTPSWHGA
jgi:hypothetical protein